MLLDINLTGHDLIKIIHMMISVAFLVCAIWVIVRSAKGLIQQNEYTKLDRYLSYAFIISLYLQVIFGIFLFSNLGIMSGSDYMAGESGARLASKRLWPIEHIVMMVFAVLIASLGLIQSLKARVAKEKHKKILIYFVISILLIAESLLAIYVF